MSKKTVWQRLSRLINPSPKLPKHAQKQAAVQQFARKYSTPYRIETGTCHGDTDTPVNEELRAGFQPGGPRHIVLIDDARCFGIHPAYPTIEQIRQLIAAARPGWRVEVAGAHIRIFAN